MPMLRIGKNPDWAGYGRIHYHWISKGDGCAIIGGDQPLSTDKEFNG